MTAQEFDVVSSWGTSVTIEAALAIEPVVFVSDGAIIVEAVVLIEEKIITPPTPEPIVGHPDTVILKTDKDTGKRTFVRLSDETEWPA
jgi:hypothetical protein